MVAPVHHCAICVHDVDHSLRFYRDGLGLRVLMDMRFEGDWPTLFGAPSTELRSVFLGDPGSPDAGIVELVQFTGAGPVRDTTTGAETMGVRAPPSSGFLLLSFFVDVEETLRLLGEMGHCDVHRIDQPGPAGTVAMATVRDPDGVLIELIARAPVRP